MTSIADETAEYVRILEAIRRHRYGAGTEAALSASVEAVLTAAGVVYEREFVAGPRDRFDFYLPDHGCGVELKTQGGQAAVLRQLHRYAGLPFVRRLLLVTTHARLGGLPAALRGCPLDVVVLWGAL